MMKPSWTDRKFWLGLACSALLMFLAVRQVHWERTAATLQGANWWLMCLGIGALVAAFGVFACRWRVLLSSTTRLSFQMTFSYLMIGYLANTVLPLRLGEVARATLLGKRQKISPSLVLGSVVLERVLDVLTVLMLALGVSLLMDIPPVVQAGMMIFAGVGLVVLLSLFWLARTESRVPGWAVYLPSRLARLPAERLAGLVARFVRGLSSLRNGPQLALAFLLSASGWIMAGIGTIAFIAAFHLPAPWYAGFFVLAVVNLGGAIPSSPGGLGVYHYLAMLALSVWVSDKSVTLGYAIGIHGVNVLTNIIIGGACLAKEGIVLRIDRQFAASRSAASLATGERP
jgi:uncharacterized protein (TIRG00374 family)